MEYDPITNRCVGFVLPSKIGIPEVDSYLAVSFEAIENMFTTSSVARYAYGYVAQPLQDVAPSFCLTCIGTDNKFTVLEVLQRWNLIQNELKSRGVNLINFAADGGSRLVKAMHVTLGMLLDTPKSSVSKMTNTIDIPKNLQQWMYTKNSISGIHSKHGTQWCKA